MTNIKEQRLREANVLTFYLEYKNVELEIKRVEAQLHARFTLAKGYSTESFAFVQTGLLLKKDVKLSNYLKMPFKLSGLYNPYTSKAFFIFGVGLSKI